MGLMYGFWHLRLLDFRNLETAPSFLASCKKLWIIFGAYGFISLSIGTYYPIINVIDQLKVFLKLEGGDFFSKM